MTKKDQVIEDAYKEMLDSNTIIPHNVLNDESTPEPTPVNGFDGEGEEFPDMTREEILERLGKTDAGAEQARAKVTQDAITGEKHVKKITDDSTEEQIAGVQDFKPEDVKKYFNQLAKLHIKNLLPNATEEECEQTIDILEKKLVNVTEVEIKQMTTTDVRNFVGDKIFQNVKMFNPKPAPKLKDFLKDLKYSMTENNKLINTMDETDRILKFFEANGIEEFRKSTRESLEADEAYETDLHRLYDYYGHYIERLKTYENHNETFLKNEIEASETKRAAILEAITFKPLLDKVKNLNTKMQKDFKRPEVINRLVSDFIGKIQNDETIVFTFPVPKTYSAKQKSDPKMLVPMWTVFMEMIDMERKFTAIGQLSHAEYADLADIVCNNKDVDDNNTEDYNERLLALKQFAIDNGIEKTHFQKSKGVAIILTYVLAKAFKPNDLNSTHNKYVLSYIMNIFIQATSDAGFRKVTHKFLYDFVALLP